MSSTDPQQYAADEISGMAENVKGQPVSEEQLAAGAAAGQVSAGIGTTEVDVGELIAQIQAMQGRLAQLEQERAAGAPASPLLGTVDTLNHFLTIHGDPHAIELGKDLAEAAANAVKSGATEYAEKIGAKLNKHLTRNRPTPGDNYAWGHAVDFSGPHLEDALASVTPPSSAAALPSAGGPPVKVIEGSVTG